MSDLVGEAIEIALGFLGQKDLTDHAVRAFFVLRFTL
jgi:hypothetical protein